MLITEKTTYHCDGKEFASAEAAQKHCNERLAEAICNLVAATLSPREKLETLKRVDQLTAKGRSEFINLFNVTIEE